MQNTGETMVCEPCGTKHCTAVFNFWRLYAILSNNIFSVVGRGCSGTVVDVVLAPKTTFLTPKNPASSHDVHVMYLLLAASHYIGSHSAWVLTDIFSSPSPLLVSSLSFLSSFLKPSLLSPRPALRSAVVTSLIWATLQPVFYLGRCTISGMSVHGVLWEDERD